MGFTNQHFEEQRVDACCVAHQLMPFVSLQVSRGLFADGYEIDLSNNAQTAA